MKTKLLSMAVAACFVFNVSAMASASNLDMFLDKCGSCHKKGAEAAPVNPADKAGVVWAKYFARGRHPGDLNASITPDEMAMIVKFLQNHAADSEHPVAAVIPK